MSGPPPKDAKLRRRRNATPGFKMLPHEGRTAPAPAWPIPGPQDDEVAMWARVWRLPQAVEWERMRCEDIVALYVRAFCAAALAADNTKLLAEVRQLDAKIGLSPKAMRDLRWETDEPDVEADATAQVQTDDADAPSANVFVP